jgi:hypothetical protein
LVDHRRSEIDVRRYPGFVGRKQFVVVIAVLAAVAIAVAVAAASRGGDAKTPVRPAAMTNAPGDDDANVMRQLQRDKAARSHK